MNNMLQTIVPKSDQMNADDLIGGQTKTIKVTKVSILAGEQPVALSYEGDGGKPYKPGKSMRRVMVNIWGPDANLYAGRSMTLYRDEKVKFGGVDVGGLRISHMSHMSESVTMALTTTKANRKPFTVHPLKVSEQSQPMAAVPSADDFISDIMAAPTLDELKRKFSEAGKVYKNSAEFDRIQEAKEKRKTELTIATGENTNG